MKLPTSILFGILAYSFYAFLLFLLVKMVVEVKLFTTDIVVVVFFVLLLALIERLFSLVFRAFPKTVLIDGQSVYFKYLVPFHDFAVPLERLELKQKKDFFGNKKWRVKLRGRIAQYDLHSSIYMLFEGKESFASPNEAPLRNGCRSKPEVTAKTRTE